MKNVVVVLAVLAPLATGSLACGRPNPRLSKITETAGTTSIVTTLAYDDKGHPSKIDVKNDPIEELTELTFTDAKLTTSKATQTFTGQQTSKTTSTSKYTYDANNKLTAIDVSDEAGATEKITIAYDASDRITSIETSFLQDPQHSKTTNTLSYGADGVTKNELVSESDGGKQTLGTVTLAYANGRLSKTTVVSNDENGSITPTYSDGGVLKSFVKDLELQGNITDKGTIAFTYDSNGRMTQAKDSAGKTTTYEYVDGDASDLDMTPNDLGFTFDLTGKSYGTPDPHTQAARLANLNW